MEQQSTCTGAFSFRREVLGRRVLRYPADLASGRTTDVMREDAGES